MLEVPGAMSLRTAPAMTARSATRDLLNIAFYYWRPAAMIAGAVVLLGCLTAILMPATWRSEARLLALNARVYDMQAEAASAGPALDPTTVVNVEMQLLDSAELHRALIRRQLGGHAGEEAVNAAVARFEKGFHVSRVPETSVVDLSYSARDPQAAAATLRLLLSLYFEERANVLTAGRVNFLTSQRDKAKAQLDAADAGIAAFQRRHAIVDIAAQIAGAVQQDNLLRQQTMEAEAALADGRTSISQLRSTARSTPQQVELYADNSEAARALGEMQASLLQLQAKRADLASRYMAGAPNVAQVDRQIANLRTAIARQQDDLVTTRRTGRNQSYDSAHDRLAVAEASVAGERARRGTLGTQLAESGARLKSLIAVQDALGRMKLQRDILADTYRNFSAQVDQANVQQNQATSLGGTNVRVVEAPAVPTARSNPPMLLIAASIVAAILIAAVSVIVMATLRETFLSGEEAERTLGLPVIAAPLDTDPADAGRATPARSDYGRLVAAIDAHAGRTGRTIMLLAPQSRIDLQDTALGLGQALERRAPGGVLLIRLADGAAVPAPGEPLAIRPLHGIATALLGTEAFTGGRGGEALLGDLRTAYDYLVLTAPPAAESFEGIELAAAADLTVPVFRAERTRRASAADLIAKLEGAGAHVPGVVLVGRRFHIPPRLYRLLFDRKAQA